MARQKTWQDAPEDQFGALMKAVDRPGVELAERIGRFQPPFEYLKSSMGGFDDMSRFLLNKVLNADPEAEALRERTINVMRHRYLDEPLRDGTITQEEYFKKHWEEFQQFRRHFYPWFFPVRSDQPELRFQPHPLTEALLDYYICEQLADYGFIVKTRKFRKNYWRCHSSLLSRRMTIAFDKGTMTFCHMSGYLHVDSLDYQVTLGQPFFFSGAAFEVSSLDDVRAQMERFFTEYIRIFPHVVKTLEEGIAAADDFLATVSRTSVN